MKQPLTRDQIDLLKKCLTAAFPLPPKVAEAWTGDDGHVVLVGGRFSINTTDHIEPDQFAIVQDGRYHLETDVDWEYICVRMAAIWASFRAELAVEAHREQMAERALGA